MDKGTLIEFRLHGERRLAVADRPEGKKNWLFIDEKGQSHSLKPQRIDYEIAQGYEVKDIPDFLAAIVPYLDPANLEVAWELLVEEGEGVTPADLAQLLYSEDTPTVCYAAYVLLAEDKIYFKRKAEIYEPRPSSQVEEIKHQIAVQEQRQRDREEFLERLKENLAGKTVAWQDGDRPRLESLEKFVLQPEQNHRLAQEILTTLDRPQTADAAFKLLVELGRWSIHENLFLRRSAYPVQFAQPILDVAQDRLISPPEDRDRDRLDLTHLKVYTIDDAATEEIDDGLSVEVTAEGSQKLWIHIADPTRLITLGDVLDLEARRRSTSLYLPTGTIPMFPKELATGPMSLVQGQQCAALSFAVVLNEDGSPQTYSIHASWIKPTYRLTYDDVDEMLELGIEAEPEIADLAKAALLRQQWRKSCGAIDIRMPESSIKVKEDDEIAIELLDDSLSRQLVAEMMILAGEVAGCYGKDNNLALPFRGQPQPELPPEEELLQLPAGPVRFSAMRRCMPRSEMGITPARHAGLGLDTYTQVTSPIRRYTDLLAHFQIKAHLREEVLPLTGEELQAIMFSVTASAYEATQVERQTNRYWGLEYLRRNADEVWQAMVLRWLREDDGLCLILLEDLGLELPHRISRSVALGDRFEVQVSSADPRLDTIRFRELVTSE
ncbi:MULTISPECIES: ribonuclease R family protein [Spirulina sp. CCY15215]|uniref:ribonuclease catalytic domain-containing protein n=1 Tax=Spirulina sp. CCY15215 TaxID=2767591 RepID=UPI00195174E6